VLDRPAVFVMTLRQRADGVGGGLTDPSLPIRGTV
jgi:hypothetical protein